MGWRLPWYSSHGSDFNYDFHVSNDESITPIEYNYKDKATLIGEGLEYVAADGSDGQGISVFVRTTARCFTPIRPTVSVPMSCLAPIGSWT